MSEQTRSTSRSSSAVMGTFALIATVLIAGVSGANLVLHPESVLLLSVVIGAVVFAVERPDVAIWAMVLLTPFETFGPITFMMTKSVKLALATLAACALLWQSQNHGHRHDPYRWPFLLMMISGFCSTLLAKSPWTSVAGLGSVAIFFLIYNSIRRSPVLGNKGPQLLTAVTWLGALSGALCIAQLLLGYDGLLGSPEQRSMQAEGVMDTFWPGIERGAAMFNGPSAAGAFVTIAAVIAFTHALIFKKSRVRYLAIGFLCTIGLLATFSRGAILGLIAGFAFASCSLGFLSRRRLWLAAGFAVLLLPLLFADEDARNYLRLGTDLVSVSESRVDAWQATRIILGRHPLFGIGFYEFRDVAQGIEGFSDTPLHPHNGFLKALVEEGPIGGCGYMLYIAAFLKTSWRLATTHAGPESRWVHGAIAGAGVSLFAQELFDANLAMGGSSIATLFATFLGLQAALSSRTNVNNLAPSFTRPIVSEN